MIHSNIHFFREWNKFNFDIRGPSFNIFNSFRTNLIKIIRPIPNSIFALIEKKKKKKNDKKFAIYNSLLLKLITRLRVRLSHLSERRLNYNFSSSVFLYGGSQFNDSQNAFKKNSCFK